MDAHGAGSDGAIAREWLSTRALLLGKSGRVAMLWTASMAPTHSPNGRAAFEAQSRMCTLKTVSMQYTLCHRDIQCSVRPRFGVSRRAPTLIINLAQASDGVEFEAELEVVVMHVVHHATSEHVYEPY